MQGPALWPPSWWLTRHWEHSASHRCSLTPSVGEQLFVDVQIMYIQSPLTHGMVSQRLRCIDVGSCATVCLPARDAKGGLSVHVWSTNPAWPCVGAKLAWTCGWDVALLLFTVLGRDLTPLAHAC